MKATSLIQNILLGLGLIVSISCKKHLNVVPKEFTPDDLTIVDGPTAQTAVRGIYNALGNNNYYGYNFQTLVYFSGNDVEYLGPQLQNRQLSDHDSKSDNSVIASSWAGIYNTINRANHVLAKVPDLPIGASFSQTLKDQLIGEAYFLRALSYFDLARTWGGVQLVLTPTLKASDNEGIKRSTLAETYAQVLNDLKAAEPLLPETTNRIRATKKTVWALRARYHLYQKEWADAEVYASKLISDNSNYKLLKPYNSWFVNNARNTQEAVFELYYSNTLTNSQASQWQPSTKGGVRWIAPTNAFVVLLNDTSLAGNRSTLIDKVTSSSTVQWYGNLYYRQPGTDPGYLIRIAELYLIRAEALAHQEKLADALKDLNDVRDRAKLKPSTASTQEEILLAIENERRFEFAFEPHRWFDLVRTGRANEVLGVSNANKYVLPVPIVELNVDKALVQNPGY